jgi:hypothetical protein
MDSRPFSATPAGALTGTLGAAANAALIVGKDPQVVRVLNLGAGELYVRPYSSAEAIPPVASAADMRVLPSAPPEYIFIGDINDRVSVFSTAGTNYNVHPGNGGV